MQGTDEPKWSEQNVREKSTDTHEVKPLSPLTQLEAMNTYLHKTPYQVNDNGSVVT